MSIVLDPKTHRWSFHCPDCRETVAADLMAHMGPLIEMHRINDAAALDDPLNNVRRCFVVDPS